MKRIRFNQRSTDQEIMDDLNCSGQVVHQTLKELAFINHWLGGNNVTLKAISQLIKTQPPRKFKILDMGCGDGEMMKTMYRWGQQHNREFSLEGWDANPAIVKYAEENCKDYKSLSFKVADVLRDENVLSEIPDFITATLFTHHFTDDELVLLLKHWKEKAKIAVVINDLHRHPLAYYSIRFLTGLFSRSAMVKYDAPLSVLRGFTRDEWESILQRAGINNYSLRWRWAFRWSLVIPATE